MNLKQFYIGRTIGFIALLIILGGAWMYMKYQGNRSEDAAQNTSTLCYIRNTEDGGSANLVLKINDTKVAGEFDWRPAEKDAHSGPFTGTIVSSTDGSKMVNALWTASGEGTTTTEQLKIRVEENIAAPGFGVMKDNGDGVYVYADPSTIVFEPNLSRVDCEK